MVIAKIVSTRSTCNSRPTGAVVVRDKHILTTGYNGSMPGAPHCSDEPPVDGRPFCYRRHMHIGEYDKYNYCRSSHAEANAIAQAARFGISLEGATLYATLAPCYVCLKLIAGARIRAVFYEYAYESSDPEKGRILEDGREGGQIGRRSSSYRSATRPSHGSYRASPSQLPAGCWLPRFPTRRFLHNRPGPPKISHMACEVGKLHARPVQCGAIQVIIISKGACCDFRAWLYFLLP